MRPFVRANIWEGMYVPERAKEIFRENQRDTVKEYTFLVEKTQCKQILLQHLHKNLNKSHYPRATTVLGPNCPKQYSNGEHTHTPLYPEGFAQNLCKQFT